jgi:disulfide bond formation protein DsbB
MSTTAATTLASPRRAIAIPAFVFAVALATILAAWAFQLVGGYVPCKLCLEERIPYYIGVPVALVALIGAFAAAPAWLVRIALAVVAVVFLYGVYLGVYHAGVEWHWWAGPADCTAGGGMTDLNAGNLLDSLNGIRIVPCDAASWRFPGDWGLSFAGWNAVVSLVIAAAAALGALRPRRG